MKSPKPFSGAAVRVCGASPRSLFLWCLVVTGLALATVSAQTSQPSTTKQAGSSKTAKAGQPAKSVSAKKSSDQKRAPLPSSPNRFAKRYKGEYGVSSRNEGSDESGASEDPTAAETEAYLNRSYPSAYVPLQQTLNAQQSWAQIKANGVGKGKNQPGAWTLDGPSNAIFPDILTFSGAQYTTSGRITALAISPNCSTNGCTLWVAAAGGGVWRGDNALSGNGPSWTFVSDSFATNAIGTLTYDAATNTLYAGTGEANASADSEAGFGSYKSTDGGDTWTQLAGNTSVPSGTVDCTAVLGVGGVQTAPAYSGPASNGRAISSIVINGSTIYAGSTRAVRGVSAVSSGGAVTLAPGLPPYGMWKSTDGGATFTLLEVETACLNPTLANAAGIIQTSFGSTRGVNHI